MGLRVAFFCDNFFPRIDGVVKVMDMYARYLTECGDYCCVFAPAMKDADDSQLPYEVVRLAAVKSKGNYYMSLPSFTSGVGKLFASKKFDLIHLHSPFMVGHYACGLAKRYKVPIISTFHSKYKDDFQEFFTDRLTVNVAMSYMRYCYNKSAEVWVSNKGTRKLLRSYGYNGEIFIQPLGIDIEEHDICEEASSEFACADGERKLLYVGSVFWKKNFKMIIDTLAELKGRSFPFRMSIIGAGCDEDEIRQYAKEKGVYENIRFYGQVSDKKRLVSAYRNHDLFFFPSAYDTCGLVIYEAAMCGLPSLLLNGSTCASEFIDGENALLAPNNARLMADRIEKYFTADERIDKAKLRAIVKDNAKCLITVRQTYVKFLEEQKNKE